MTDQEKGNRTTAYVITFAVDETTDSDGIAFALRDYHAEFGFKAGSGNMKRDPVAT